MTNDDPTRKEIEPVLLEYLYGLLPEEEAKKVEERLANDAGAREALERARQTASLLAEAARLTAPAIHKEGRKMETKVNFGKWWGLAAATVVALVSLVFAIDYYSTRSSLEKESLDLRVQAPRSIVAGAPAEVLVTTTTATGEPTSALVTAKADGFEREFTTDEKGEYRLVLPNDLPAGTVMSISFVASRGSVRREAGTVLVADRRPLAGYVSTDKPLYRPGETLRFRGVMLERLSLSPAGDRMVAVRVVDPRGSPVFEQQLVAKAGVVWAEWPIPAGLAGGRFKVEISDLEGALFAPASREVAIRGYRASAFTTDIELDRDSYAPGARGTATFSAKTRDGKVPAGADLQGTVTVDGKETSRWSEKLPASGALSLPFELPETIERGQASLAVVISDGASREVAVETIPVALDRVDLAFFPEGGDLVAGLPARVYFVAKNPAGERIDLSGKLLDDRGRQVASLSVEKLGMGCFEFAPEAGRAYRVEVTRPAGVKEPVELPAAKPAGVALASLGEGFGASEPLRLRVASTGRGIHTVAAYLRGAMVAQAAVEIGESGEAEVTLIPTVEQGGTFRVTVFDTEGNPAAERLVARDPAKKLRIVAVPDAPKRSPGDHVKVTIETTDPETGKPVEAFLGVAVVDEGVLNLEKDEDVAPLPFHFLVGLDVEELEKVQVYLDGTAEARRALDLLLGTQGWRRFSWRDPAAFAAKFGQDAALRILWAAGTTTLELPQVRTTSVQARSDLAHELADHESAFFGRTRVTSLALACVLGLGFGFAFVRRLGRVDRSLFLPAIGLVVALGLAGLGLSIPTAGDRPEDRVASAEGMLGSKFEPALAAGAGGDPENAAWVEELGEGGVWEKELAAGAPPAPQVRERMGELRDQLAQAQEGEALDKAIGLLVPEDADAPAARPMEAGRLRALRERLVLREYARSHAHEAVPPVDGERSDFEEVVFWDAALPTGPEGKATIEFDLSHSLTTWRIRAEGHGTDGRLGTGEGAFLARLPFSVEPKLPIEVTSGDRIDLPVSAYNDSEGSLEVLFALSSSPELAPDGVELSARETLAAGGRSRLYFPLRVVGQKSGKAVVVLSGKGGALADKVNRTVAVVPFGYPVNVSRSGVVKGTAPLEFVIPEGAELASLEGEIRIYPSTLATLLSGMESMLSEPGGCFEQTSSSNYPNVMVLQYLSTHGVASPEIVRNAKGLLERGYGRLTGYECPSGGFDWWGEDPGHTALTGYGVLEFLDMGKVYPVDPNLVPRTIDWLLGQRADDGYFTQDRRTLHTWVAKDAAHINTAYICWAISEGDGKIDLGKTLEVLRDRARGSEDPYFLALVANTYQNLRLPEAQELVDLLAKMQLPDGHLVGESQSITCSTGVNLEIETTALAALSFLKESATRAAGERAVEWLLARRQDGGRFGATQGTILALKALVRHAELERKVVSGGRLELKQGGEVLQSREISAGEEGVISLADFAAKLPKGTNRLELSLASSDELPYSLTVRYRTSAPPSDPDCAVSIETALGKTQAREGETVPLSVKVSNRTDAGVPMTVAIVGLPGGLEARADQLEELKKAKAYEFYEVRNREVILYWTGLDPKAAKEVHLDLVAAVPGEYTGPASTAYLYYADDKKDWTAPLKVAIDRP